MIKGILLKLLFILTVTLTFAQTNNYERIYFIKFKLFQKEFNNGVPFAEICLTDKNDDFIINCNLTDIDGYAIFHINPNKYNIDSTYLTIRFLKENTKNEYGDPIKITLIQIELLEDYILDNDFRITLTDYKLLSEKEYNKHRKQYGLMPGRQPTKAIDVR